MCLTLTLLVGTTGSAVTATMTASAAGAASTPALDAAAHAFGARLPAGRVAPRVVVLDTTPASVDLRRWAVAPGNQGRLSSCVTWAIDYSMLGWYSRFSGRAGQPFAPMYTYSQINGGADGGSYPTSALYIAQTQGNDTRADYTQGDYDWKDQPTAAERANAAHFKIARYETLFMGAKQAGSAALLRQALASNHPVAIEMAVRAGFEQLGSATAAVDTDTTSAVLGYHEVLALGYDGSGLIVENSWGTGWAAGGYGRISWGVVQNDVWEADTIDGFAPLTPPSTSAPVVTALAAGATRSATTVSYKASWTGTPGTSGAITRYDAWYQVDGGALVAAPLASAGATSFTLTTKVGHTYRVAVQAHAGTSAGVVRYGAPFVSAQPGRAG